MLCWMSLGQAVCLLGTLISYIIWLSVIQSTNWLNTATWLKHNSVCSPPQSCGGGTLIDTTKCFHSGKNFHANKWQNELAILSFQKCMLTALDRALAVYCAHSTIDTAMCLELGPALGWSRFIFKWNFTYLPWLQYLNMNESLQISTHFKANLVSFKLISNLTSLHIN